MAGASCLVIAMAEPSSPSVDHNGDGSGDVGGSSDGKERVKSAQDTPLASPSTVTKKPLQLLDLPMDILTEIIKEVN